MADRVTRILRWLFFELLVRPLVLIVIGLNVRHRERLPLRGPAVLVANHNSHLDTLVMMTLLPASSLPRIHPVAAADYFLRTRWMAWFATRVIGILPVQRGHGVRRSLDAMTEALDRDEILVLFPEGSRGRPEELQVFKRGIAHLAARRPGVPVVPVFLHGLGKVLPKGEGLLVPFFCDVFVGEALAWQGNKGTYMAMLDDALHGLAAEGQFPPWT